MSVLTNYASKLAKRIVHMLRDKQSFIMALCSVSIFKIDVDGTGMRGSSRKRCHSVCMSGWLSEALIGYQLARGASPWWLSTCI